MSKVLFVLDLEKHQYRSSPHVQFNFMASE